MIKTASKTLAAIDAAIVASQEEPFRKHLGSSVIGDECARKLYYGYHWALEEKFDPRMLRLFNRGHLEEDRFVNYLRSAGCEIWVAGEFGEMKDAMRFSDHLKHFGGTPDAIGKNCPDLPDPTEPFLCEFKTHNDKSYTKLLTDGLMKTKWKHFVQMQVCMKYLDLRYGLYCAVNKDTDAITAQIISFDEAEANRASERAGRIIWAKEPPPRVAESPASWMCKYCHLSRLCHRGDIAPHRNCRTCHNGSPSTDGSGNWVCSMDGHSLDEAAQRAACPAYAVSINLKGRLP
jgi:hypothetical protein